MALIGKSSYLGEIENNVTGSSQLVSRNSRFTPINPNPTKYYQTVGTARRKPGESILGAGSFAAGTQGTVTGGSGNIDPNQYVGFMTSEADDALLTENDNNIILE